MKSRLMSGRRERSGRLDEEVGEEPFQSFQENS
jgi:hypothetical protein